MMQRRWAVSAGLGILLISAGAFAQESQSSPQLRVLSTRDDQKAPTIVRGTVRTPRAAAAASGGQQFTVVAGRRLWLIDQDTGEVTACRERDTSTVGRREIRCTTGETGRYARTFGPDFRP
jgi:hypothetical protein